MNLRLPRGLLRATLVLGVVGALTAGAATAVAPAQRASVPSVGDCHKVTVKESAAAADPDPAVRCSTSHSSRTIHVAHVPRRVSMNDLRALDKIVTKQCRPLWERAVSPSYRKRLLSSFVLLWFTPTKAQIRAGARWLRCDVALSGGTQLAPLPTDAEPALRSLPYRDSLARCQLGKQQGYRYTVCSRAHAYRAKGTFTMRGGAYPSSQSRNRAAMRKCPTITGSKHWLATYPSREGWNAGFRLFVCSLKTTR